MRTAFCYFFSKTKKETCCGLCVAEETVKNKTTSKSMTTTVTTTTTTTTRHRRHETKTSIKAAKHSFFPSKQGAILIYFTILTNMVRAVLFISSFVSVFIFIRRSHIRFACIHCCYPLYEWYSIFYSIASFPWLLMVLMNDFVKIINVNGNKTFFPINLQKKELNSLFQFHGVKENTLKSMC